MRVFIAKNEGTEGFGSLKRGSSLVKKRKFDIRHNSNITFYYSQTLSFV